MVGGCWCRGRWGAVLGKVEDPVLGTGSGSDLQLGGEQSACSVSTSRPSPEL